MTQIILSSKGERKSFSLLRADDSSDVRYRLNVFDNWLDEDGTNILSADLKAFRNDMLREGKYAPRTVAAILSTVRERMRDLARDNDFIEAIKEKLWRSDISLSPSDLELQVQAMLRRMENSAHPKNSRVSMRRIQDHADQDEKRLWLDTEGIHFFLEEINTGKAELLALRDRAIAALFLATGLRNQELCDLRYSDIFKTYQEVPALLVRQGKGNKQRMVIYGDLWGRFVKPYVLPWIEFIHSHDRYDQLTGRDDFIFRGFWKGWKKLRSGQIDQSTVNRILGAVSLPSGDVVKPHDLRRTYARMLFQEYSMSVTAIQQQMGHANQRTTLEYIGLIDVDLRTPQGRKP